MLIPFLGVVAVGVATVGATHYGPQIVERVNDSSVAYRNEDGGSSQTNFQDDKTSTRMTTTGQHPDGTKFTSNGYGSFNPATRTTTFVMELDKGRQSTCKLQHMKPFGYGDTPIRGSCTNPVDPKNPIIMRGNMHAVKAPIAGWMDVTNTLTVSIQGKELMTKSTTCRMREDDTPSIACNG